MSIPDKAEPRTQAQTKSGTQVNVEGRPQDQKESEVVARIESLPTEPGGEGFLFLDSRPQSLIAVDGRRARGVLVQEMKVSVGEHRIAFRGVDGRTLERVISVPAAGVGRCNASFWEDVVRCSGSR